MISNLRRLKALLSDIYTIRSKKRFHQNRAFYFRIFKRDIELYKKWVEPAGTSKLALDIIIPVVEKDINALPEVIAGVKKHIKHPIAGIYIIAPQSQLIKNVAESNDCIFVDEQTICNTDKAKINFVVNGYNRSGWIYQQLLKLNFDKIGTCENYLVVDADTVFVKDTVFEKNGKFYFDFSDEYHTPYYQAFEIITALKHQMPVSFIAHYMLFNKAILQKLKLHMEQTCADNVENIIIGLKDKVKEYSYFSEYETYANYCIETLPDNYLIRYWFNKSYPQKAVAQLNKLETDKNVRTISFHSHNQ